MSWSLRTQMMLPIAIFFAIVAFVVGYFQAALQIKEESDRAIAIYLDLAHDLEAVNPADASKLIEQYENANPSWRFVIAQRNNIYPDQVKLTDRQRDTLMSLPPASYDSAGHDAILLGSQGKWYYVSPIAISGWPDDSFLICLEPYQSIATHVTGSFRQTAWWAFGISCLLVLGAAVFSGRLVNRVIQVQQQVRRIADGDLSLEADERGTDEISQLARSVNEMAAALLTMKQLIEGAERARLHSQLARGLAHELRNGIHAARLSLEVFQDVNQANEITSATMVENAKEQLTMTESLVRRLLTVGKETDKPLAPLEIRAVLVDVAKMIAPVARHAEVTFQDHIAADIPGTIEDSEGLQSAVLNLCLNAIEAAGRHGNVALLANSTGESIEITVSDSGPGPHPSIADKLFDPFMTTKPDGIGLGLVLVRQSVQEAGGTVSWERKEERTHFKIRLPTTSP